MKKLRKKKWVVHFLGLAVVAVAAFLIGNWVVWGDPPPPTAPSSMMVSVTNGAGQPVPVATVTIQGAGQDPAHYRQGLTDGTGVFKALGLAGGNYVVTVKLGELSTSKTVNMAGDTERFVLISLDGTE